MGTKEDAIALYAGGYTYRQIERMPGMPSRMTLWRWVNGRHDGAPGAEADGRRTGMAKRGNGKPELPRVVGDGPTYPDIDPEDKDALIERLQLENDILRGTQEVLKGRALGSSTNREKSELIEWLRANTARPLSELTASLRISRSSYEYWRTHLHDAVAHVARHLERHHVAAVIREQSLGRRYAASAHEAQLVLHALVRSGGLHRLDLTAKRLGSLLGSGGIGHLCLKLRDPLVPLRKHRPVVVAGSAQGRHFPLLLRVFRARLLLLRLVRLPAIRALLHENRLSARTASTTRCPPGYSSRAA